MVCPQCFCCRLFTCALTMGAASARRCRNAKACTSLAATPDLGDIFVAHDTVGMLSLRDNTDLCRTLLSSSLTSQCMRSRAISRSEFVMIPLGLWSEMSQYRTSWGHSTRYTVLGYSPLILIQTPPTPASEASTLPKSEKARTTSSLTCVGRFVISPRRRRQSLKALCTAPFGPM